MKVFGIFSWTFSIGGIIFSYCKKNTTSNVRVNPLIRFTLKIWSQRLMNWTKLIASRWMWNKCAKSFEFCTAIPFVTLTSHLILVSRCSTLIEGTCWGFLNAFSIILGKKFSYSDVNRYRFPSIFVLAKFFLQVIDDL